MRFNRLGASINPRALFVAPTPVERKALARVFGRDASIDLLIDDIREGLRGKPYAHAGAWAFRTGSAMMRLLPQQRRRIEELI